MHGASSLLPVTKWRDSQILRFIAWAEASEPRVFGVDYGEVPLSFGGRGGRKVTLFVNAIPKMRLVYRSYKYFHSIEACEDQGKMRARKFPA